MSKMALVFFASLLIAGCVAPKANVPAMPPTRCVDFETGKPFKCPVWMPKATLVSAIPEAHGDN